MAAITLYRKRFGTTVGKENRATPLLNTKILDNVLEAVNVDCLGPLPNGKYLLVLIDQRSRFPVIDFTKSTDASTQIFFRERTEESFIVGRIMRDGRKILKWSEESFSLGFSQCTCITLLG